VNAQHRFLVGAIGPIRVRPSIPHISHPKPSGLRDRAVSLDLAVILGIVLSDQIVTVTVEEWQKLVVEQMVA
jgi:hypothetical protein